MVGELTDLRVARAVGPGARSTCRSWRCTARSAPRTTRDVDRATSARCCADCRVVDDRRRPPLRAEHPSRRGRRRDRRARQSSGDATVTSRPKKRARRVVDGAGRAAWRRPVGAVLERLPAATTRRRRARRGAATASSLDDDRLDQPGERRAARTTAPTTIGERDVAHRLELERQHRRDGRAIGGRRGAYPRGHERRAADRDVRRACRRPCCRRPTPRRRAELGRGPGGSTRASGGTRSPRSPAVTRASSTPGPSSATSAATTIERYAYYRVGYHRGLDALRANGWRGSGYVRWSEPTNRGFLRALAGLGATWPRRSASTTRPSGVATFLAPARPARPACPTRDRRGGAVRRGEPADGHATRRFVEVGGVAMAERVARALAAGGCDPVVFVGGDPALLARFGRPVIADRWPGEGPARRGAHGARGRRRRRRRRGVRPAVARRRDRARCWSPAAAADGRRRRRRRDRPAAAGAGLVVADLRGRTSNALVGRAARGRCTSSIAELRSVEVAVDAAALRNVNTPAELSEAEAVLGTLTPCIRDRRRRARRAAARAGARLIDVREPDEYTAGHVPGAISSRWHRARPPRPVRRRRPDVRHLPGPAAAAGGRASSSRPRASTVRRSTSRAARARGSPRPRAVRGPP